MFLFLKRLVLCDIAEMYLSELTFLVLKTSETATLGCTNDADEVSEPLISSVLFEKEPTPKPPSFSLYPPLPSHAVTLQGCTCQISPTSSAATPYDTPLYRPRARISSDFACI